MRIPNKPTALFLSHGGGPMPLLGDDSHQELVDSLAQIASVIDKPSAIIVISAHWEEDTVSIIHKAQPSMVYDYHGFPEKAYQFQYPASGAPQLAEQIQTLFASKSIDSKLDEQRGFDHGMYVPLMLMYPDADIPCIQISLKRSLDAAEHLKLGEALSELNHKGLLILGSGFTFHNMEAFRTPDTPESMDKNEAFEAWLINTCTAGDMTESERTELLINWEQAPYARYCHPREEHLLPLHVCYGVAKSACIAHMELSIINKKSSIYFW